MQAWSSREEIAEYYGFDAGVSDEELRSSLKKLLKEVHPDGSGGEYVDAAQREKCERLNAALDLLKRNVRVTTEVELVAVLRKQNELAETQAKLMQALKEKEVADQRLSSMRENAEKNLLRDVERKYRPILFTSGAIAATGVFLTTIGEPIVLLMSSAQVPPSILQPLLALMAIIGALACLVAYLKEDRDKSARIDALSERHFVSFIESDAFFDKLKYDLADDSYMRCLISVSDIVDVLGRFKPKLDTIAREEIAVVVAERLVNRNLAQYKEGSFVSPKIRLTADFADELFSRWFRKHELLAGGGDQ